MKEKDMHNPNTLGHYHRDIVEATPIDQWHTKVTMSCNHTKEMSRASYKKFKDHATLCMTCSDLGKGDGKKKTVKYVSLEIEGRTYFIDLVDLLVEERIKK